MGYVTSGCPKKASALLLRDPVAGNIGPGRMGSCRASLAGGVVAQPRLTHAPRGFWCALTVSKPLLFAAHTSSKYGLPRVPSCLGKLASPAPRTTVN